ncbi:MAG TPA: hypothetical protein VF265_00530 [Nevskiaceae bacterium]
MKTGWRWFGMATGAALLTQLAACAYQQPYGMAAPPQAYQSAAVQPGCNAGLLSDPLVASVIGGGLGGLVGNQFGKGGGNAAMTALGAVGGVVAAQHLAADANRPC